MGYQCLTAAPQAPSNRWRRWLIVVGLVVGGCLLVAVGSAVGFQQSSLLDTDHSDGATFQQVNATGTDAEVAYLLGDGSEQSTFYTGGEIVVVGQPIDDAHAAGEETVSLRAVTATDGDRITGSQQETTLAVETAFETVPFEPAAADTPDGDPPTAFVRIPAAEDLPPREYFVRDSAGRVNETSANTVEVATQSLRAEWENDGEIEVDTNATTELELRSNRVRYNLNVSAPGLEYDQLESLFLPDNASTEWVETNAPRTTRAPFADADGEPSGDNSLDDRRERAARYADEDVIVLRGQRDGALNTRPANAELEAGALEFNVSATDSNATAAAPLTVTDTEASAAFVRDAQQHPAGGLVEMTVELEGTDATYLVFGSADVGYVDVVYLEDDTDNGRVEFVINTRVIGTEAVPTADALGGEAAFRSGSDIVRNLDATDRDAPPAMAADVFAELRFETSDGELVSAETDGAEDGSLTAFRDTLGLGTLIRPIQPAGYELRLTTTGVVSAETNQLSVRDDHDITQLTLSTPDPAVTTHIAPSGDADAASLSALRANMTTSDEVALGDRLVIEVDDGGYVGALSAAAAETGAVTHPEDVLTDTLPLSVLGRLVELEGEGIDLELVETSPRGNQASNRLALTGEATAAAAVYLDPETQALYLVVDTRKADALFNRTLRDETTYTARVRYTADDTDRYRFPPADSDTATAAPFAGGAAGDPAADSYPYLDAGDSVVAETTITVAAPSAGLRTTTGDTALLERGADATLAGRTNVAPGTPVQVLVDGLPSQTSGGIDIRPFSAASTTTVGTNGTVEVPVDTTGGTRQQELEITLRSGSRSIATIDGRLITTAPAVSMQNQTSRWQLTTLTVGEVGLPEGGFIAIHDERFFDGERLESLRGITEYHPQRTTGPLNITLTEPYQTNGTAVAAIYSTPETKRTIGGTERSDRVTQPYVVAQTPVADRATITIMDPTAASQPDPANATAAPQPAPTVPTNPSVARSDRTPAPPAAANDTNASLETPTQPSGTHPPDTQSWFGAGATLIALCIALLYRHQRAF